MQVCSCQLPVYCLMLLWRRLQCTLAWWQHSNLPADFVWVVATSFLFKLWIYCPVGTLDCDFWIDSLQIFRGFRWSTYITILYLHPPSIRLQWTQKHNYKSSSSVDLLFRVWPSSGFVVIFCSARSTYFVSVCKEYSVTMNTIKR